MFFAFMAKLICILILSLMSAVKSRLIFFLTDWWKESFSVATEMLVVYGHVGSINFLLSLMPILVYYTNFLPCDLWKN